MVIVHSNMVFGRKRDCKETGRHVCEQEEPSHLKSKPLFLTQSPTKECQQSIPRVDRPILTGSKSLRRLQRITQTDAAALQAKSILSISIVAGSLPDGRAHCITGS
jgi:hypothetical protein